jgi:hypothetical protein
MKKLTKAENNELAVLLQAKAQEKAKTEPIKAEKVDASLHGLCVKMVQAEGKFDMAQNAVYVTFKAYVIAYLPLGARMAAHAAATLDIKTTYGEARAPAAIQRITMLNNIRTIAHGKAATRNTPAQPAQGIETVLEVLETMTSLPALKKALGLMKSAPHGATGIAKHTISNKAPAKPVKAGDVVIPSTRAEAIKAACRILETVAANFLTISKDSALLKEVQNVVAHLKAA